MQRVRPPARISKPISTRRGVAAVEFALILPLLLLIVLGCVDFGRFASRYIAVTNAARAGAGFAMMNPYTVTTEATWATMLRDVVADEIESMYDSRFAEADLQVNYAKTTGTGSRWQIEVTVSFPFQTLVPWPGIPSESGPIPVSRTVEMRGIR